MVINVSKEKPPPVPPQQICPQLQANTAIHVHNAPPKHGAHAVIHGGGVGRLRVHVRAQRLVDACHVISIQIQNISILILN